MKFNKILLITLLLLAVFTISAVSAADNLTDEGVLQDTSSEEIELSEDVNDEVVSSSQEDIIGEPDNGTFTALQKKIKSAPSGSTITLENDYVYDEGFNKDGIIISKPVTINGNGHKIDALSKSRIFHIEFTRDVALNNIVFCNGQTDDYGGAIYSEGDLSISQSKFVNNKASKGGAIYQISSDHYIETWYWGDYLHSNNLHLDIYNTKFINNTASSSGGAICMHKSNSILNPDFNGELYLGKNITFEGNTGDSIISLSGPDFRINEAKFINNRLYGDGPVIWVDDIVVNSSYIKFNSPTEFDAHHCYLDEDAIFKDNLGNRTVATSINGMTYLTRQIVEADDIGGAISINGDVIRVKFDSSYNEKGWVNLISSHESDNPHGDSYGAYGAQGLESDFVNGVAVFNINDINNVLPGKYLIEICYAKNNMSSVQVPITLVKKVSTKLTSNDVTTTYNVNKDLIVTLKDGNGAAISGAKISIDLNGVKTFTTDSKGQVKIATGSLAPNVYNAKITFAGDDNYDKTTITVKVTIEKSTQKSDSGKSTPVKKQATKIIANNKNFKAKTKVKKYTVTLKTKAGKAIKNAQLIIKINKKTYKAKTNNKGKATFNIKNLKKKGTYKATITFKGNKNFKKVTKTVKIIVK